MMTHKAIKRLLITVGLALLLLTVVLVPPGHAAPLSQPASAPSANVVVQMTTVLTTITPMTPTPLVSQTLISSSSTDGFILYLIPLLLLGLLLIILMRRRRSEPIPPSPSPPATLPPPTTGPYLESVRSAGSSPRLHLKPHGVTIGRAPENDLIITQDFPGWETVSQRHAWVYQWADHWIIEDINSTNGIHVNGKRTGRNLLRDGWQLDIGGVEFVFRANTEEAEQ